MNRLRSMGRFLLLSVIAGAVAAIAIGVVIATGAGDRSATAPTPPSVKPASPGEVVHREDRRPPILPLTDEQVARAKDLFANDPRVHALLQGRAYRFKQVLPWSSGQHRPIGAAVTVELDQPATLEGEWPDIKYDKAETTWPPHAEIVDRFSAEGVSTLFALADLARNKVVSVQPLGVTRVVPTN